MFDMDFRIRYYLGALSTYYMEHKEDPNPQPQYTYYKQFIQEKEIPEKKERVVNYSFLKKSNHSVPRLKVYCSEMSAMLENAKCTDNNQRIQVILEDNVDEPVFFSFAKTRPIYCRNVILLKWNKNRHWGDLPIVREHDIPFHSKRNVVVWRGSSTGLTHNIYRDQLVRKYQYHPRQDIINIRYSNLVQGYQNTNNQYLLQPMSIQDQLKHKFIISIEGNDVATNLKWAMYSNSAVLMPPPRIVSWFMEDQLLPYIHYIPLKEDLSDVEEKYHWCMSNLDMCEQIAKNGKEYVEQFLNDEREKEITKKVIQTYCKAIKIISP